MFLFRHKYYSAFILFLVVLFGCDLFNFDPSETVKFQGRVVEAYDTDKPIDSVFVEGCKVSIFLAYIPNTGSCDFNTYTDANGYFDLQFEAKKSEGRKFRYYREGYYPLDSCKILSDGTYECYMEALPTNFYIYSPIKEKIPFVYDSATFHVYNSQIDDTRSAWTEYFINVYGDTAYYWNFYNEPLSYKSSSFSWETEDNSNIDFEAYYYRQDTLIRIDTISIFCAKGESTSYRILDD